ncbi:hypothetical protein LUD75_01815 [Epilithonimonas sp. JDS]|uniref:hypothetical protein n=1 Tax=Epilithonimonas sp. JDS TaxID=2902797 RepID=UPI001E284197|nr:hypothetical protein [Epilithonimonas sp. JDS]MCD9853424.1 hypothetical protein [Epilithonimonas sp. JDS]
MLGFPSERKARNVSGDFPILHIFYWLQYPFLNVLKLGYGQVSINIIIMLFVFLMSGSVLIAINNKFKKR